MTDDSPSSVPEALPGLAIEAVEWLPSGSDSGLVRVRGRWTNPSAQRPGLPQLVLRAGRQSHRFESLPDARFARDPSSWRGSYLVPAALVAGEPEALWVEWPGGVRSGLPALSRGLATPPPAPPRPAEEPEGGQLIDREVLAERRARRAEAAEQEQARIAAEALRAVEALELQCAELEHRLAEVSSGEPAPPEPAAAADATPAPDSPPAIQAAAEPEPDPSREAALAGALGSLSRLRAQSIKARRRESDMVLPRGN